MSIAGLVDSEKPYKKSFHQRNVSGELDVFEAAWYFSGYTETGAGYNNSSSFTQKMMRDEIHRHRRTSLDMPMRNLAPQQFRGVVEKQMKEKKPNKQPNSPGGRLASFLNSLFSQSASKKKKSKSMKDHEDESPGGGRRRRRSSISHFRSSSNISDSKSKSNMYSSSSLSLGFRTPPHIETPTKTCKEFGNFSDQKKTVSFSNYSSNGQGKPTSFLNEFLEYDKNKREINSLADNRRYRNSFSEKNRKWVNEIPEKDRVWKGKYSPEEQEKFSGARKFGEIDDGAESDSSSDLFELQINYDLGDFYSSGLPIYETTNMDNIKKAPISNGNL